MGEAALIGVEHRFYLRLQQGTRHPKSREGCILVQGLRETVFEVLRAVLSITLVVAAAELDPLGMGPAFVIPIRRIAGRVHMFLKDEAEEPEGPGVPRSPV